MRRVTRLGNERPGVNEQITTASKRGWARLTAELWVVAAAATFVLVAVTSGELDPVRASMLAAMLGVAFFVSRR
jgi:hypothetical protein